MDKMKRIEKSSADASHFTDAETYYDDCVEVLLWLTVYDVSNEHAVGTSDIGALNIWHCFIIFDEGNSAYSKGWIFICTCY